MQKAIREKQSATKSKVDIKIKESLVTQMVQKSIAESEVLVSKTLHLDIKSSPSVKHQRDESVRLEVTLSKVQWQKLEKMRVLLSHALPHGSWDQVLEYVSDKVIQQKDKSLVKATARKRGLDENAKASANTNACTSSRASSNVDLNSNVNLEAEAEPKASAQNTSSVSVKCNGGGSSEDNSKCGSKNLSVGSSYGGSYDTNHNSNSSSNPSSSLRSSFNSSPSSRIRKPIPMASQREVFRRDRCCQYTDKHTGRQCGSVWQLSIDHVQPVWAGGGNDIANLRVLCASHNRYV